MGIRNFFSLLLCCLLSNWVSAQAPAISSFFPASGPVGSTVTISGNNFNANPANNIVYFGTCRANVTSSSNTQLLVTAPPGATYQPISVTVNSLTGYSTLPFVTSFSGASEIFNNNTFAAKADATTGTQPYNIATGDFDNDGKPDIAVSNFSAGTVSVLRNTGTPGSHSLLPKIDFACGPSPYSVAVADLNADGKPDIAVTNATSAASRVSVLINTSAGAAISFDAAVNFPTGDSPFRLAINDIDGDGKPDIVATNNGAASFSVLRNTSTGNVLSFAPKIDISANTSPLSVALTDMDGDGKADVILTAISTSVVSVYRNSSTVAAVSFEPRIDFTTGNGPRMVITGDLDGDGKPDIATNNTIAESISIFRNTGSAGMIAFAPKVDFAIGQITGNSEYLAMGDLSGDAKPEIVVVNTSKNNMSLFKNNGSPGVVSFETRVLYNTGTTPQSITMADFDGDAKQDIAVANNGQNSISVFRRKTFPTVLSFMPASGPAGSTVTVKGYNFNPLPEAITVYFGGAKATVSAVTDTTLTVTVPAGATFLPISVTKDNYTAYSKAPFVLSFPGGPANLENTFAARVNVTTENVPKGSVIADFDADGKNDIAVTNSVTGNFSVLRNTSTPGNLTFANRVNFVQPGNPTDIKSGDLNGDGKPDIITIHDINAVAISRNTSTPGVISFVSQGNIGLSSPPSSLFINDLNLDGNPEIIMGSQVYVTIIPNNSSNGTLTFAAKIETGLINLNDAVAVADLNGDGKPDIIMGNSFMKNTSVNGVLSFDAPVSYSNAEQAFRIEIGDLNNDGKPDLAAIYQSSNEIGLFLNTSTGTSITFSQQGRYSTGYFPNYLAIADMNGDSFPDISVGCWEFDALSVFANTSSTAGPLTFLNKTNYATNRAPWHVAVGDLDGDGKPDMAATNRNAGNISILRFQIEPVSAIVPTIQSFTPAAGPVGTIVQITGTHFSSTASENIVFFGAVRASVISASNTALSVKVPAGSTYEPISVTNQHGLTAYSYKPFNITFPGGSGNLTAASFDPFISFPTGAGVSRVALGDLDGDGKTDIVTSNTDDNSIAVLRNVSAGSLLAFAPKADYAVGLAPLGISIGDIDGDGKPDVAVVNQNSYNFSLFRNTSVPGTISFADKIDFASSAQEFSSPQSISIRDIDGDGKPDIVIAVGSDLQLSFFRNISTGSNIAFAPIVGYGNFAIASIHSLAINDFDRNGKPDVVAAPGLGAFNNTSNTGAISFTGVSVFPGGSTFSGIACADFNNDDKADLAVSDAGVSMFVLKNESIRNTVSFGSKVNFGNTVFTSHAVEANDIDGDGKPDAAVLDLYNRSVSVLKNSFAGSEISFNTPFSYLVNNGQGDPLGLAIGDMDGDGKPDLVVTSSLENIVSVLRNKIGDPIRLCSGGGTILTSNLGGTGFQWQVSTDNGTTYTNIINNSNYSGTNTANLQLSNIPSSWTGYIYKCSSSAGTSDIRQIRFYNTWTGAVNNQWENPANWSCGSVPDMFTDVIINSGATVVVNSNITVATMLVANGAVFTVNSGNTVTLLGH